MLFIQHEHVFNEDFIFLMKKQGQLCCHDIAVIVLHCRLGQQDNQSRLQSADKQP